MSGKCLSNTQRLDVSSVAIPVAVVVHLSVVLRVVRHEMVILAAAKSIALISISRIMWRLIRRRNALRDELPA
jgi:FlaA1/EpsC-like NDP-sugar epimerase